MTTATARACANIALVKYWGKRDAALNLPAAGSLSLTLAALVTETTVAFDPALAADTLELDGLPGSAADLARTTAFLDLVRAEAGLAHRAPEVGTDDPRARVLLRAPEVGTDDPRARVLLRARVTSRNHFPTASGLASSASGFAALALAATRAAGLTLEPHALSVLARRGSGSAARSIFGGFVRMHDAGYAEPIASPLVDQVRMVIAVVGAGAPKTHGSRDAMEHTAATSPLYRAWLELVPRDLAAAEAALAAGDLAALGAITESNALAMHASAIAARPAIVYWRPATLALLAEVTGLRQAGVVAWATMDAGPHVKVLTTADDADTVASALLAIAGVTAVTISEVGGPAQVVA